MSEVSKDRYMLTGPDGMFYVNKANILDVKDHATSSFCTVYFAEPERIDGVMRKTFIDYRSASNIKDQLK